MGGFFIERLFDDPAHWLTVVAIVVASIVLHELGHALAATWEGDPTPRRRGHITWNPLVHMGWLSLGLVAVVGIGFGATPVTPAYFRHRRWGEAMVLFAGPAVNALLAVVASATLAFAIRADAGSFTVEFWDYAAVMNVALFLFNMIPVPPFDGFGIAESTLRLGEIGPFLRRMHPYPLLVAFVVVGRSGFWGVCHDIVDHLARFWLDALGGHA